MKKTIVLLLFSLLAFGSLSGQEFPRGAVLDEARYNSLPQKAAQLSRGLKALPRSASLKQYAPFPGDQGQYSTCTAWAAGYAARTIAESIAMERQDRTQTTNSVFSPVFIYKSINDDPACVEGTAISDALDVMKDPGIPRRNSIEQNSDFKTVQLTGYLQSPKFPIAGYVTLFNYRFGQTGNTQMKIQAVKKSLSEGKPVIIGMNTPNSFDRVRTSPWIPLANANFDYGGHAMCVVGYDDDKFGGAFEIQNSWGTGWADDGYIWIQYNNFGLFVAEAYELIEDLSAYRDSTIYSGFVEIEVYRSAVGMPVVYDPSGFYRTENSYPSGTMFRYIMGNNTPAYVYAFSADSSTAKTDRIFPPEGTNISPVLDYSENVLAWPGENDWIKMDDTVGTDYLVVLFSKQELDIDAIRARFTENQGSFPGRVAGAVGPNYVSLSSIQYETSSIEFTAAMENKYSVVGLLLAIEHH